MLSYICHRLKIQVMENMTGFLHSIRKQLVGTPVQAQVNPGDSPAHAQYFSHLNGGADDSEHHLVML